MKPILQINDLTKSYTVDHKTIPIIRNLSFNLEKGAFLSIVGKSGCGKSTLLKLIGGFELADAGQIMLEKQIIMKPSLDRIMVFQDFNQLFPWQTILQNVIMPLRHPSFQLSSEGCKSRALEYLDLVGLSDYNDYYPHQLSGGMKQRAALARALALNPKLLLMDEPFASLDMHTRISLQNLLLEIWKKTNTTILFVTHDIQEAITLSSNLLVMGTPPNSKALWLKNTLPEKRIFSDPGFSELYDEILSKISG